MYILHTFSDRFAIDIEHTNDCILIDRESGAITHTTAVGNTIDTAFSQRIYNIIGIANLLRGKYLILCTDAVIECQVNSHDIYRLTDATIIPYNPDTQLTTQQLADENQYLALLRRVLLSQKLYFSYTYDITHNQQDIIKLSTHPELSQYPSADWRRSDIQYMWNYYLANDLISANVDAWITPIMNGYVTSNIVDLNGTHSLEFCLLSRRSWLRTGKRFISRGIDDQGNVSNYAETEQLLFIYNKQDQNSDVSVLSYVQIRGSVPLYWQQAPTLKYAPTIQLSTDQTRNNQAFKSHFDLLQQTYGNILCINLINQKGAELQLMKGYTRAVQSYNNNNVRLINWDFHHECKNMKYENISKLYKQSLPDVQSAGYLYAIQHNNTVNSSITYTVHKQQTGVIRSNCIDCLDRTNVVQSYYADKMLDYMLREYAQLNSKPSVLIQVFRDTWANNADAMSLSYSGTGALKTDYTRTGKRTSNGAIQDGINSLTRYYLNNFQDGINQDSLDLFLGYYIPNRLNSSPYNNKSSQQYSLLGFISRLWISCIAVYCSLILCIPHAYSINNYLSHTTQLILLCTVCSVVSWKLSIKYGHRFVNQPRLRKHFDTAEKKVGTPAKKT